MAFDDEGNLYSAASYMGRKGVVRIKPDRTIDHVVSGPGIVGLAFSPSRAMIVATTNAIFRVDVGIRGAHYL
jgi:sugar lactone lactonase YvrE